MGGYTVDRPPGEGWKAVVTEEEQKITFSRGGADGDVILNEVLVRANWAEDKNLWKLSEQELAKEYFKDERAGIRFGGILMSVKIEEDEYKEETIYVDNKKLYNGYFRYTTEKGDINFIVEQSMYLYFPPGYKNDDKFIVFLVTEAYKPERNELADLSVILPVIKSLQLDLERLNE